MLTCFRSELLLSAESITISYLYLVFSPINTWLSREEVKASLPQRFLKLTPNLRIILGRTHVSLEAAPSERLRARRRRCAPKGLLGAADLHLSAASLTETSPRSADSFLSWTRATESWHTEASWITLEPNSLFHHAGILTSSTSSASQTRLGPELRASTSGTVLLCSGKFPK